MKTAKTLILLVASLLFCISCFFEGDSEPEPEPEKECNIEIDSIDFSFGITHENPAAYLIPGAESDLDSLYLKQVKSSIGTPDNNFEGVLSVCHWVNQNFTFSNAGGSMMGVNTVDELFEIRTFYGCHSQALIISSILRKFGFPAIMIETAQVQWGYDYNAGQTQNFKGHVMSEIYVNNKWVLLDNNCRYVEDYDYMNPFIFNPSYQGGNYFVYAKGVDIWDYTNRVPSFAHDNMIYFSDNIYCFEDLFNTVSYDWGD